MSTQELAALYQAIGSILAAIIVAIAGGGLTLWYNMYRARQDKESQWRQHALELAKLDMQRNLEQQKQGEVKRPLRPSILDFLANYRDLKELDYITPRDLYTKILATRISVKQAPPTAEKPKD